VKLVNKMQERIWVYFVASGMLTRLAMVHCLRRASNGKHT
jgi:hypothetical protein